MNLLIKVGSERTKVIFGSKKRTIETRPLSVTLFCALGELVEDKKKLEQVKVECSSRASLLSCNVARSIGMGLFSRRRICS